MMKRSQIIKLLPNKIINDIVMEFINNNNNINIHHKGGNGLCGKVI